MKVAVLFALALLLLCTGEARGEVFYAQDEALELAFPHAEQVTPRTFILTAEQRDAIERRGQVKLPSSLLTLYIGQQGGRPLGYAFIDTVEVRSMTATIMTVINAQGAVEQTVVLAFHEPPEYLPPPRWLERFEGKTSASGLFPGREIPTIAGSTLSAEAISRSVRIALAAVEVLVKE